MISWLLTYLIHSTLLIGMVALVSRHLSDRHLPLKEALWRLALIGGLVTSSLQIALPMDPLGGRIEIRPSTIFATASSGTMVTPPLAAGQEEIHTDGYSPGSPAIDRVSSRWLLAVWIGVASLLTFLLLLAQIRLGRLLRQRQMIDTGPLRSLLDNLRQASAIRQQVRLSSACGITGPLAKGWIRGEICLPQRAILQLSAEQQEIILAHELAHLERHDPLWLLILRLLECVFFFQPLNKLGRRQLQEIAEYRCDDRAVRWTGRPLTMARCLADVAQWNLTRNPPTPALTSHGKSLKRRVTRLLDRTCPLRYSRRPVWWLPFAAVLMVLIVIGVPGFSAAEPDSPPSSLAPDPIPEELPARPEPPAPVRPVEEPSPAPQPVPSQPTSTPVPASPSSPLRPVSPVEPKVIELEELQQRLQLQQHAVVERIEAQVRSLERVMAVERERLEKIPIERIEALELKIHTATRLHQVQMEKLVDRNRDLLETVQREQRLGQDELLELHEEHQRRRQEFQKKHRDSHTDESSQEEPPARSESQ